jgi:hypothetical protein
MRLASERSEEASEDARARTSCKEVERVLSGYLTSFGSRATDSYSEEVAEKSKNQGGAGGRETKGTSLASETRGGTGDRAGLMFNIGRVWQMSP